MATTPRKDLPGTNAPNWNQRVTEELRVLMGRAGNGRALTAKDLIDSGIAKPGAGGGLVPGVPGSGDTEPDLTPPPMPTGFAVSAGLSTVFVEHDAPGYTQGHGHDRTVVYGVLQTGSTAPTFDQAVVLFQFQGTIGAYPAALGTRYRLWIKWQSQDGVQSVSPAGGTNGLDVQTGKIGNNDLGPLIVEAGNLANGSVSASKLAAQAVDATKFAAGIEPVSVSTAGTLPTVKSTSTIVWQGKLYRWDGSKYSASVPTVDLTGTIIASQIAAGAIDATKFASGIEPVTNSAAASLPTVKSTTVITWQGKLYRWDGAKYTAEVSSAELADNAVTVNKIAAGAVEAGKLATGAVTADKIAAAAVDTTKFAPGIEPVTNSTASTLPTVKSTTAITWQGKLYRWDGSKYTAAVPTTDLTGTIIAGQIAAGAVDITKFASGIEPVTNSTAGTLPTVKSTTVITWQGKLYRWDGAKYSAEVAVGDMVGQIAATQIADNAITTPKLAANSVAAGKIAANAVTAGTVAANAITAGTIAAGAVNARELAANSVTADKMVVGSTTNLLADGSLYNDGIGWQATIGGTVEYVSVTDGPGGVAAKVMRITSTSTNCRTYNTEWALDGSSNGIRQIAPGTAFRVKVKLRKVSGTAGLARLELLRTGPGQVIQYVQPGNMTLASATVGEWVEYSAVITQAAGYTAMAARVQLSASGPVVEFTEMSIVQMAAGELIVDGSITASKMTLSDTTNFVLDSDFNDVNAWSVGAVQNFVFEAGETADNAQRVARYTTALRTGAANAYIGEFVQQPRLPMEAGRQVFFSLRIRDYTTAEGRVDIGIATTKANGAVYSNIVSSRVLGTANGYAILSGTYTVAADDVAIGWRVRWQYSAAGRFVGPFKIMNPTLRVMGQADLIVDGAITAGKIAALAVTAGTVAANAITADNLQANSVTTAKIATGAVSANEIAAGAITAAKLAITSQDTVNIDPFFEDLSMWNLAALTRKQIEGSPGPNVLASSVSTNFVPLNGVKYAIDTSKTYLFETWFMASAASPNRGFTQTRFFDVNGALITGADAASVGWPGNNNTTGVGNFYFPAVGTVTPTGWTRYTLTVGPNGTAKFPTKAAYMTIGAFLNYAGAAPIVESYWGGVRVIEMSRGELIVDGAITAAKIAAKTITAAEIAAGTITATELGANSVTANAIAANSVIAGKIATNAVTADSIAANSVTTAKIAAGAVSATELAAGSVLASKLLVADTTNPYGDFDCVDPNYCTALSGSFSYSTSGASFNGKNIVNIPSSTGFSEIVSNWFSLDASAEYLIAQRISTSVTDTVGFASGYIELGTYSGSGAVVVSRRVLIGQNTTTSATPFSLSVVTSSAERYGRIVFTREAGGTARAYLGAPIIRRKSGGNLIVDGAITASKMVLADTSNAYPDYDILDDAGYTSATPFQFSSANTNFGSKRVVYITASAAAAGDATVWAYADRGIQLEPNSQYLVSMQSVRQAATAATVQILTRIGVKTSQTNITWDAEVLQNSDTAAAATPYKSFTITTGTRTRLMLGMRLLAGAVSGAYFGAITIRKMNGAELIVDGAIIAGKIATNAVTADKIEANAITAAKIAVGAVGADQIAANAITVKQLTVMDYSNIVLDPFIQDTTSWATFTGTQVTAATSGVPVNMPGPAGILLSKATAQSVLTRNFQTSPGEVYYLSAYVASPTTTGYAIRLMMQFIDPTGAQGDASGTHVGWAAAITLTAPAAVNTWQKIEGFVTVPAGVAFGRARIVSETGSAVAGSWYATNFVCRRATSASLIVDGAITATKIAAGAIAVGSAAIQDGAIVNAMIGNLSADKITAGTLNAARIAAGTITSSHLSANSVIAGKIAANAVTAGTIAANAVTATQIAAGSITVDKLAAGSVTADKLTVGTGGNLCPDSTFTPGLAFWNYWVSHSQYASAGKGVNLNDLYAVRGSPTLWVGDTSGYGIGGAMGTYNKNVNSGPVSVLPGERYEVSLYGAWHRCNGSIIIEYRNASGSAFAWETLTPDITDPPAGGQSLSGYRYIAGFITIPANATTFNLVLRAGPTWAGQSDNSSYMFITRPFIGRAHPNQTTFTPWSPSSNTNILPDGITTPSIAALAGRFGEIDIRPQPGSSGVIRVWDENNILRVELGII